MTSRTTHAEQGYRLYRQRRVQAAVLAFREGMLAGEDPDAAALERWLAFMTAGEFESAWQESDRVLRLRKEQGATCTHLAEHQRWLWDGTPLAGKRIRVRCYHGLGDTIQFARFLPRLSEICAAVAFEPQPELRGLIPRSEAANVDFEIESMEIPHALRTTLETIPHFVPYLKVPGMQARVGTQFRVGLVWMSGAWRPERSVPLQLFRFLDDVPGLTLVALQRGLSGPVLVGGPRFHEADWENRDVAATARTICGLDLVITTDTMVAHLAGALGARVWTLLHWDADWRWLADRDDSPWYPTMRLFRQRVPGDWQEVVERVRLALYEQAG